MVLLFNASQWQILRAACCMVTDKGHRALGFALSRLRVSTSTTLADYHEWLGDRIERSRFRGIEERSH
jgi:hypothetical protein